MDSDPEPSSYGSGKSSGSLRIRLWLRIHNTEHKHLFLIQVPVQVKVGFLAFIAFYQKFFSELFNLVSRIRTKYQLFNIKAFSSFFSTKRKQFRWNATSK
jgi:hypothetical protein